MESQNSRAKRWCFTLNNPTFSEENDLQQNVRIQAEYCIYGRERGELGTRHLQGFITFQTRKAFKTVKKIVGDRAHLETTKGTVKQNQDYCSKDGDIWEWGVPPPEQSKKGGDATKRKWEDARAAAKEGRFDDIPSDMWIRYRSAWKQEYTEEMNRNITEIRDITLKDHFYWIWGPTGTGKSHLARAIARFLDPSQPPYLKALNKWWNGYKGQKVTLIEEATPDTCRYLASLFKQWCDKWPFTAEVKGGSYENGIRPAYIIITSNYSIEECFPNVSDSDPMKRRCTEFFKGEQSSWFMPPGDDLDSTLQMSPDTQDIPKLPRCESGEIDI